MDFLDSGAPHSRSDTVSMIEVQCPHEEHKNKTYCTHPKLDFSGAETATKGLFLLSKLAYHGTVLVKSENADFRSFASEESFLLNCGSFSLLMSTYSAIQIIVWTT